ncbi:MAG: hypothetical protein L6Q46_00530 [Flavobacterium sp.]|uniref:hypothetical protein n=1 Tax=Flavobacterium sp. TaxID=239 RepID=UPI0025C4B187|nr:hypothetical protein [Flavobacterium sp.]MCK6606772.1 hypothetical protein [Flavobacterium sp.]
MANAKNSKRRYFENNKKVMLSVKKLKTVAARSKKKQVRNIIKLYFATSFFDVTMKIKTQKAPVRNSKYEFTLLDSLKIKLKSSATGKINPKYKK